MRKSQFYVLSFLGLFVFLCTAYQADACFRKKKKKRKKAATTQVQRKDSVVAIPAPGVINQASHDSLKAAQMLEKLKSSRALVVSFISLSAGIDAAAEKQFAGMLKNFNESHSCQLSFDKQPWGREGERDYCLVSSDADCLANFATSIKEAFKGNRRVLIRENSACRP